MRKSFSENMDDLNYLCSKDYRDGTVKGSKERSNSNMYRTLRVAWIIMIVNIIPLILTWTLLSNRMPTAVKVIYTVASIFLIVAGVAMWFVVTKENDY